MDKIIISECLTNKSPILNYLGFNIGVNAQISGKQRKKGDACVVEAKSSVRRHRINNEHASVQRKAAKSSESQRPPPLVTSQVNIQRNNTNKMKLAIAALLAGSAAAFNVKEVRISSLLIGGLFRAAVWSTTGGRMASLWGVGPLVTSGSCWEILLLCYDSKG